MKKGIILEGISIDELGPFMSGFFRREIENLPKENPNIDRGLYGTRKEVAKTLHISLPTLNELTKTGVLIGYRLKGRVLYKWVEVDEALERIATIKYSRTR